VICPACGSEETKVDRTADVGRIVTRSRSCECGARWATHERIDQDSVSVRSATGVRRCPPVAARSRGQPPVSAGSPLGGPGGFGGDLFSDPSGLGITNGSNHGDLVRDPEIRSATVAPGLVLVPVERSMGKKQPSRIGQPDYPMAFLEVWEATGKRGTKSDGLKAWIKIGRPSWESISTIWAAYMRSDNPSRGYVKELSTWFNKSCHTQEWLPAGSTSNGHADDGMKKLVAAAKASNFRHPGDDQ
jgi:hypothetical protein